MIWVVFIPGGVLLLALLFAYLTDRRSKEWEARLGATLDRLAEEATGAGRAVQDAAVALGSIPEEEGGEEGGGAQAIAELPQCVRDFLEHAIRDARVFK